MANPAMPARDSSWGIDKKGPPFGGPKTSANPRGTNSNQLIPDIKKINSLREVL